MKKIDSDTYWDDTETMRWFFGRKTRYRVIQSILKSICYVVGHNQVGVRHCERSLLGEHRFHFVKWEQWKSKKIV